ncbi:NADH-quinone oxidoreductase subunit NuoG [Thalassomonas sp. M1454]|uniref:NADH-quinone oxidoreductase subunit NuoG n=1 Tax=Thalassomonas sp. M1454 TaxID=2594477 RepID=UPI00163DAF89|nr:NADH-quinone oxidoreductase subunit NuoG [Thalassomonas sp. M1454]
MSKVTIDERNTINIYVDGVKLQVDPEDNLLAGVLSNKLNLPYFCWHPSMGSIGACRQCAVTIFDDESQTRGRIAMACMTPVTDGMYIGLGDEYSTVFREQVISAMMTNHPHDCPVCAEGGECHLQDMTVMTGHSVRDYKGDKRTFENQDLGPYIGHEMNRCITCYRCVRYYKDYAGGTDFGVFGSRNKVCFGRQQDGVLESEFSGNLVEVCPTGVFTDKPFSAHYARKWDLQSAPSICQGCSVGCNISIGERYGSVRRIVNRYNDSINGYFLCDRGRFGFGYINSDDRLTACKGIKFSGESPSVKDIHISLAKYKAEKFIAIGSSRASLETNTALKQLLGADNFCAGLTQTQMLMLQLHQKLIKQHHCVDIDAIEQADFVLILGEDVTQTAPRIALALRQSVRNAGLAIADRLRIPRWQDEAVRTAAGKTLSPLFIAQVSQSKLDDVAQEINYSNADDIALITQAINAKLTAPDADINYLEPQQKHFVASATKALQQAQNPLIVSGHSLANVQILQQCLALAENHQGKFGFAIMPSSVNSLGLASLIDQQTLSLEQVITQLQGEQETSLIIAENELSNLTNEGQQQLLSSAATIIALEHSQSVVCAHADVILPVACFAESQGLVVNYTGSVQCFYSALNAKLPILPSWRYIQMLDGILGQGKLADCGDNLNDFRTSLSQLESHFPDTFKFLAEQFLLKTARQTHRSSGRTAMTANQSVHEAKTTLDDNSPFNFSMEGGRANNSSAMPFTWAPGWNSNQSISKYQEFVGGKLSKSPAIVQIFDPNNEQDLSIQAAINSEVKSSDDELKVYPAKHIFANDYLGIKTSEFKLTKPIPFIELTPNDADKYKLVQSSHACIVIAGEEFTVQVKINAAHAKYCATLFLNEQVLRQFDYSSIIIKPAISEKIHAFDKQLHEQIEQINQAKQQQLRRLKQQDQFIPIRLMAGGLDDG